MTNLYTWLQARAYALSNGIEERIADEGGLEAVEYIAMIFLALLLILAVATVLSQDTLIGETFIAKAVEFINSLGL